MYGYKWRESEQGIFELDVTVSVQKEIRPVFREELEFFGMSAHWSYPETDAPLLWAEGIRKYVHNGEVIASASGGSFYEKPKITIKNEEIKELSPISIQRLVEVNHSLMTGLVQKSIQFIREVYEEYRGKGYQFVVAFSGGKDSIVLLDLVQRALSPDQFFVIFGDTGMELSDTYKAVEKAKEHYPNLKFYTAKSRFSAEDSWDEFGHPGRRLRWCCGVLKSVPTLVLLRELSGTPSVKAVVYDGIRSEESEQRSTYENISTGKKHINQVNCSPILSWSTSEVYLYMLTHDIFFNDAYRMGLFRVGCAVCPMSSAWWDGIANFAYKDDLAPYLSRIESYAIRNKSQKEMKKYISSGGWKARFGGRGLENGGNRVHEVIEEDELQFHFTSKCQSWINVAQILGFVIERTQNEGSQLVDNITFDFKVSENSVTYYNYQKMSRSIVSQIRGISKKVAYCTGCDSCSVICPTGAFIIDENKKIQIKSELCIHCGLCISQVPKGCKVAASLATTKGGRNMDLKGISGGYQHFGLRTEWLEHYFELGNECWGSGELGNCQYDALDCFLRDSEVIDLGQKKGQTTELGFKLKKMGPYSPLTWAIIWTNMSYNSVLVKWYLLFAERGETYTTTELQELIEGDFSKSTRVNAISSLRELFQKSPIGASLEMGIPIHVKGKTYKYKKQGWSSPHSAIILYALFRYAEKLGGHYSLTLNELKKIREDRPEDFVGMDPVTIFALEEDHFKEMLRQLAHEYPDFLTIAFVADLDNISLNREKTSLDVVDLILGGDNDG